MKQIRNEVVLQLISSNIKAHQIKEKRKIFLKPRKKKIKL